MEIILFFAFLKPIIPHAEPSRGEKIYMSTCIRCHNKDPNMKGSIGPELTDTPLDVMMVKIPEGRYPEGYKPKRTTKIMPKFPQYSEQDIEELYIWIQRRKK